MKIKDQYPKPKRKRWRVKLILMGVLMLIVTPCVRAQTQSYNSEKPNIHRPNIIIIFLDDVGYGDMENYGGYGYTTPHIDKLANEGMRFTNFYAQPVCSASRASLLTGTQPSRVGFHFVLFPHSKKGLNPKEETIADMLKKAGYATGMVGKWHLGDAKQFLPLQQGFDMYLGLPYSNDMWPRNYQGKKRKKSSNPPMPLIDGNKTIEYIRSFAQMDSLNLKYTKRAVRFINRHKSEPFFLYFAHNMAHTPLFVSDKFRGKSKEGRYGDVMEAIDWSAGRIMQALRKNGIAKNTLIIFTSDNGPWLNFGKYAGSAGGLREGKATTFGGGLKEPAIFSWPVVIPKGTINNQVVSEMDILPTLAKITGAPLPERKIDGVNVFPLLKDPTAENPRKHLFYYYHLYDNDLKSGLMAVRKRRWKLILPHKFKSYEGELPGENDRPGSTHIDSIGLSLYNLRRDPGERYNVIKQHPRIVGELMKLVKKERKKLGDANLGIPCSQCRKPGLVEGTAIYPSMANGGKGEKSKPTSHYH
jgi:arylsulfatase